MWQTTPLGALGFGQSRSLGKLREGQMAVLRIEVSILVELHEDVFVFTFLCLPSDMRITIGSYISLASGSGCQDKDQQLILFCQATSLWQPIFGRLLL